ncbi:MAG: glycoside hydrolase family 65 protein [Cytophagales bacterium]|nr:glycoside hydrolase family 65 protein [Armatimonadota bacterium]
MKLLTAPRIGGMIFAALLLSGCLTPQATDEVPPPKLQNGRGDTGAFKTLDPWVLNTTDSNANRGNHGIFLGNGYVGATFGANGGASKESVSYLAGKYDAKETITQRGPLGFTLSESAAGGKYAQTLDIRRGLLTTRMGSVTATTFASSVPPYSLILHVQGAPPPSKSSDLVYGDTNVAYRDITATDNDGSWTRIVTLSPKGTADSTRDDYEDQRKRQESHWQKLWQDADIQIEGDPEAQQLVRKLMFDLLQSTRPGASDSIPPESLSGDFYKGHIFWDAEVWMFPALLAQHPNYARSILDYRFKHLAAAKAKARAEGYQGADFPWESAATGKEVAPSGFSKGRHVTAGVGWAHWQYWLATQDKEWLKTRGWPVLSAVADFWASRAKKNARTGKYDVLDVYGPDENKGEADNNTYTNALARYCLLAAADAARIVGETTNPKWLVVAAGIALPFDREGGYYLARQNDEGKATKQADGELVLYPAALPMDRKTAEATFDFHSKRPIKNGPAMTDAMHALIAARLGRAGEAEQALRDSYRPFVRGPFLLFSEKRSLDRCVFTTGAGGVLQAILYGFGGLDFSQTGGIIAGKPALPASWKKLTITGIRRGGKTYTLTVTPEKRTLKEE